MVINGNCLEILPTLKIEKPVCIVTDPPFNIGYHYKTYKDRLEEAEYYEMLKEVFTTFNSPYVVIHYPESINRLSIEMGEAPSKVCEWVYNSNNRRQHRSVAYYRVNPIFSQVKQPYKNPNDKRVKKLIENGSGGGKYIRLVEYKPSQKRVSRENETPLSNAFRGNGKSRGDNSKGILDS